MEAFEFYTGANPELHEVDPALAVAYGGNYRHLYDDNDRQYLAVASARYPSKVSSKGLSALFLDKERTEGSETLYRLPDGAISFAQSLNESIGSYYSPQKAKQELYDLFYTIGRLLRSISVEDKVLPKQLMYQQILFSRSKSGIWLLPPVEIQKTTTPMDVYKVGNGLRESIMHQADFEKQRTEVLLGYEGFVNGAR